MKVIRPNSAPLPVALLALSVAVCLGSVAQAAPVVESAITPTRSVSADQRDALEQLLAALTDAARKLGERLDHQAQLDTPGRAVTHAQLFSVSQPSTDTSARLIPLRDALLNLPPPVAG